MYTDEVVMQPQSVTLIVISKRTGEIEANIEKPKHGYLYFMDKRLFPVPFETIIIGGITINVDTSDGSRVEFYIDEILKNIDYETPYTWYWNEKIVGLHEIKVVVYGKEEDVNIDEINVVVFNPS